MPLRLAGEDQAAVLGLDGQGWVREARAPDGGYSLKLPDATTAAKGLRLGAGNDLHVHQGSMEISGGATKCLFIGTGGGIDGASLRVSKLASDMLADLAGTRRIDVAGGGISLYSASNGDIALRPNGSGRIDTQGRIYNSGAGDGGAVAVTDAVRVAGPIDAWDNLDSGSWQVALNPTERAAYLKFRTAELDPGADGEGILYLAEVGGARKLVAKVRSGGVVYTGTLALT